MPRKKPHARALSWEAEREVEQHAVTFLPVL